jgi:hypothetical protein
VKVILVSLKCLLPNFEYEIELILLLVDFGGLKVEMILNERLKRAFVAGVTIITYIIYI